MNSPPVSVGSLRATRVTVAVGGRGGPTAAGRGPVARGGVPYPRVPGVGDGRFAPVVVVHERLSPFTGVDESAARRALRDQVAQLERELAATGAPAAPLTAHAGPRLLGLGELEATRDALVASLREARELDAERAERQARAHALLVEMRRAPAEHKWLRVSDRELGLPGCGQHHVLPRLGLLGMLLGWWRVKVSSGCPLPTAPPEWGGAPATATPPRRVGRRAR